MRAQTRQQAKWKRAESNISAEEEEEVKRKVEWDGMAPPQVLLTAKNESTQPLVEDGNATKKNTTAEVTTTTSTTTTQEKEERKREKKDKKRKRQRKEEESGEKDGDDDEDVVVFDKKSKPKAKKQKVSKKSAYREIQIKSKNSQQFVFLNNIVCVCGYTGGKRLPEKGNCRHGYCRIAEFHRLSFFFSYLLASNWLIQTPTRLQ